MSNAAALNFSFSRVDPQMRKKTRPLKLKKKLYEFYSAPITKYYSHCVSGYILEKILILEKSHVLLADRVYTFSSQAPLCLRH